MNEQRIANLKLKKINLFHVSESDNKGGFVIEKAIKRENVDSKKTLTFFLAPTTFGFSLLFSESIIGFSNNAALQKDTRFFSNQS